MKEKNSEWEYKRIKSEVSQETLNEYGAEGWELVCSSDASTFEGNEAKSGTYLYLKRKKENPIKPLND